MRVASVARESLPDSDSTPLSDVDEALTILQTPLSDRMNLTCFPDEEVSHDDEKPLINAFCEQMTRNVIRSVDSPGSPHLNIFKDLMHESRAVLYAVRAITTLHTSSHATCPDKAARARTLSLKHQAKAIDSLKRDLQNAKLVHTDAVLATTLLLYLFEQVSNDTFKGHSNAKSW